MQLELLAEAGPFSDVGLCAQPYNPFSVKPTYAGHAKNAGIDILNVNKRDDTPARANFRVNTQSIDRRAGIKRVKVPLASNLYNLYQNSTVSEY